MASLFTPRYNTQPTVAFAPRVPVVLVQAPERYLFAQAPTELLNPAQFEPVSLNEPTASLLDPFAPKGEGFRITESPSNLTWDWNAKPVYVVSPVNNVGYGPVAPPAAGQFYDEETLYAEVLEVLARLTRPEEDRKEGDIECGLYEGSLDFNPDCPGTPLTSGEAFIRLHQGCPVFFLPQFGNHEVIDDLAGLDNYMLKG